MFKKTGVLFLTIVLFTACGRGGGGGSSPVTTPSTPAPAPTAAPIATVSTQRSVASETLSVAGLSSSAFGLGTSVTSVASIGRSVRVVARTAMSGWHEGASRVPQGTRSATAITYSACSAETESATVPVTVNEYQLYLRTFYDDACTLLNADASLDIIANSQSNASLSGSIVYTSRSRTIYDYQTLALTLTTTGTSTGTFTLSETDAPSATATNRSSTGVSCIFTATSISCGGADVSHATSLNNDFGAALSFTVSSVTAKSAVSPITVPISGSASSYGGALGSLNIQSATIPNWSVSGASPTDNATFNGTFVYTPSGALGGASLTLTDASADATVTMATATNGSITATIAQTDTGKTAATFTVDSSGNGTITYGNGTTAQIVNWSVLG